MQKRQKIAKSSDKPSEEKINMAYEIARVDKILLAYSKFVSIASI